MALDNRIEINDCESSVNFNTDGAQLGDTNTAGFFYEGLRGVEVQHTNTDEATFAINNSAGTALNLDLTSTTVYLIAKDNLTDTEANNGVQVVLGDGTRRYGYTVGGSDGGGVALSGYWRGYKLDTSNINLTTPDVVYAGTGTLSIAAITQVGFGTLHISKARGNITNLFLDYIAYDANADYHLTINGGTVGTPETFSDVATDDVATGTAPWGIVSQPITGSFSIFSSTEWGDTGTADSYFETSNESIFLLGETISSGNFLFRVVGNTTGTNSFVATNSAFNGVTRATGSRPVFDWSDANVDTLTLSNCGFVNIGTQTFGANNISKSVSGCTFTGCDQISFNGTTVTNCTFNGANNANGAILVDDAAEVASQTNLTFNAEVSGTPSGHAVQINATTGTFAFNNWSFTSGDFSTGTDANGGTTGDTNAAVFCSASSGSITITVVDGDTPSVYAPNGVTVTVVNNITAAITGILGASEIRVLPTSGSPYSGNSLNDTLSIATERVSADIIEGDGTDYISYSNNNGKVRINANGAAVFSGVLTDGDVASTALTAGDTVCVFIRDDVDNPTLQLADEFIVATGGTGQTAPTSTTIDTDTDFATFTSVFGTSLSGSNSKIVSVERKDARFEFQVAADTEVDFLVFRIANEPTLVLSQIITADNRTFPISQVNDRTYRNPA